MGSGCKWAPLIELARNFFPIVRNAAASLLSEREVIAIYDERRLSNMAGVAVTAT